MAGSAERRHLNSTPMQGNQAYDLANWVAPGPPGDRSGKSRQCIGLFLLIRLDSVVGEGAPHTLQEGRNGGRSINLDYPIQIAHIQPELQ